MPIPMVRVGLYEDQIDLLEPMEKLVREADEADKPGMMLAQIYNGVARVFFADGDQARAIQAAMGSPVGRTSAELADAPDHVQISYS